MTHRERERPDEGYEDSHWESIARFADGMATPDEAEQVRARLAENQADAELLNLLDRGVPKAVRWEIG
ncbi:MAG: hypothetical protein ABI877_23680, partial [Gemmatimonadaceae bacterium]